METTVVATLQINPSQGAPSEIELRDGQSLKIGRDDSNHLVLNDPGVSRIHAAFSGSLNGVVLADLGSTNGTFVNGERITGLRDLSSGDLINIGAARISVSIKAETAANSLSAAFSSRAMTAQLQAVPVAVLIAAVSGYDRMQRSLPPLAVAAMLERWQHCVRSVLQEFNGELDKLIGASAVALWTGSAEKELAARAAHAALRLRDLSEELSTGPDWPHHAQSPWQSTLVISSGRGLSGSVVSAAESGRQHFTMLGDPVNTAFRLLELVGKLGENLIIAGPTATLLAGAFDLKKIITVKIKGYEDGLETFTLGARP